MFFFKETPNNNNDVNKKGSKKFYRLQNTLNNEST